MKMLTINEIYDIFYTKLPASLADVMPVYDRCKLVTCLNPYYLIMLDPVDYDMYNHFDYIASDGMGPIILNKLLGRPRSVRLSFDLSSMAGHVFNDLIEHRESLFILGAKPREVDESVKTIQRSFNRLLIAGYHHGYIQNCKDTVVRQILDSQAKVVIIGMGAPLQDEMSIRLKNAGFVGTIYTCGGFIHQTTESIVSFPNWTNTFGLRWLYRIFTQKGMLRRLVQTYPKFVFTYWKFLRKMPRIS